MQSPNTLPTFPETGGSVNLEALQTFFPAPFLRTAILAEDTFSPLVLVLTGRNAGEEHIRLHSGVKILMREMSTTTSSFLHCGGWASTKD